MPVRGAAALAVALSLAASGVMPAGAAAHHRDRLSRHQVARIVTLSGYRGLRPHRFDIARSFAVRSARIVVVRLDRAAVQVPITEVRRDLRRATALAATRRTFTSRIKVGHGPKQRISYEVVLGVRPRRHRGGVRYVIFTPRAEPLAKLTRPARVPSSVQALTVITGHRLNLTLLHNGSRSPHLDAMVECLNTTSRVRVAPRTLKRLARHHVDLSYLTDPNHHHPSRRQALTNLASRGLEIWSNSLGFAVLAARRGTAYRSYAQRAADMRFDFYRRNDMRYLEVTAKQYRRLA